jgi:hypothetical protein
MVRLRGGDRSGHERWVDGSIYRHFVGEDSAL